jgi:hypothetical protein
MIDRSQAANAGVAHIGRGGAGRAPLCGTSRAHITLAIETFKAGTWRQCKRCAALLRTRRVSRDHMTKAETNLPPRPFRVFDHESDG